MEKHRQYIEEQNIEIDPGVGSAIGIHGVPEGKDYYIDIQKNWTYGCISMKTKDIKEISRLIKLNITPIKIIK